MGCLGTSSICVSNVDGLRGKIIEETNGLWYSIHPRATKMYRGLHEFYWWDCMNKDVAGFEARCPNCQQVKAKYMKPRGLLPTSK